MENEIEINVSPEYCSIYRQLAVKRLQEANSEIGVRRAGINDAGENIFGIYIRYYDGTTIWYDPYNEIEDEDQSLVGWNDIRDAQLILEEDILPSLGYVLMSQDLVAFHANM